MTMRYRISLNTDKSKGGPTIGPPFFMPCPAGRASPRGTERLIKHRIDAHASCGRQCDRWRHTRRTPSCRWHCRLPPRHATGVGIEGQALASWIACSPKSPDPHPSLGDARLFGLSTSSPARLRAGTRHGQPAPPLFAPQTGVEKNPCSQSARISPGSFTCPLTFVQMHPVQSACPPLF